MQAKPKTGLPDFKELTQRISFVEVLRHYNLLEQMRPRGNQPRGVCPIPAHQGAKNKNSLSVNTARNCFKCFSCGAQGNILDFVVAMEGCSKYRAGRLLEGWFPSSVAGAGADRRAKRVQEKKRGLPAGEGQGGVGGDNAHGEVNPPLTFVLQNLDTAHSYLLARAKPDTVKRFGLGVFSGRGLMTGRLVIPIHNERGELVAYAGRALDKQTEEVDGKYKLPVKFKKGRVLFNLHRVVEAVRQGEPLILVEGFFDVFRLYELGYPNAVALMGSDLTAEQERLLKSVLTPASRVALLFDNDPAGLACRRDVAVRLAGWCFVKVVGLPEGVRQPDQLQERIEIF